MSVIGRRICPAGWRFERSPAKPYWSRPDLDAGEREALALASELKANLLLIDERPGTLAARRLGFRATGTLGVLIEAAQAGLILIDQALARLEATNFRRTPDLFDQVRISIKRGL